MRKIIAWLCLIIGSLKVLGLFVLPFMHASSYLVGFGIGDAAVGALMIVAGWMLKETTGQA